jgi:CCR4-NOT transcription complex subunit 9
MPALLQEIVSVYPLLSPPTLTAHVSNRVCNALALLQCVASHSETRQLFLNGVLSAFIWLRALADRLYSSHPLILIPIS